MRYRVADDPEGTRDRWTVALVIALAAWAIWNGVRHTMHEAPRHRAESAWFLFALALIIVGVRAVWLARFEISVEQEKRSLSVASLLSMWAVAVTAAFALYAPALDIGLLSDDFVLLSRARRGALIEPSWEYVRPLPIALWQAVDRLMPAASVAGALHALNLTLHGTNASLVFLLARGIGSSLAWAACAALLFLTAPVNVEAVVWASGIFDVLATCCALISVNIAAWSRLRPMHVGTALLVPCQQSPRKRSPLSFRVWCCSSLCWFDAFRRLAHCVRQGS